VHECVLEESLKMLGISCSTILENDNIKNRVCKYLKGGKACNGKWSQGAIPRLRDSRGSGPKLELTQKKLAGKRRDLP
jgi:hypothetical protein